MASPTQSYWQRDPHALASTRSPVLPRTVDIAIIGSGVTGASVSKAILENDPKLRVALFEARTLCSGATGRNGGQLATAAGGDYSSLVANFGAETAGKIVNLTIKTTSKMREMILKYAPTSCDFQDTTKIRVYLDSASFQAAKSSVEQLERDHPLLKGEFKIIGSQKIKVSKNSPYDLELLGLGLMVGLKTTQDYGISKGYGAMLHRAGSVWPYRFITKVFEALLEQHRARFTIETNTPVTSITYDGPGSHPYQLHTPRGTVRCTKVIHCTNGYAGHLLPGLRGCMFPLTGSMTVQNLQSSIPNRGTSYSWGFHYLMRQDYQTGKIMDGLQYLIQSPKSNLFFSVGITQLGRNCCMPMIVECAIPPLTSYKRLCPSISKGRRKTCRLKRASLYLRGPGRWVSPPMACLSLGRSHHLFLCVADLESLQLWHSMDMECLTVGWWERF